MVDISKIDELLKRRLDLPEWFEKTILVRSGSASVWYAVFIAGDLVNYNVCDASMRYIWPANNGVLYHFLHEADAEKFIKLHS